MDGITQDEFDKEFGEASLDSVEPSALKELGIYIVACKKHGGLLSQAQVARLAGVTPAIISRLVSKDRFTVYHLMGLKCLPVDEVKEYLKLRDSEDKAKGGRGLKAPKLRDMLNLEE